MSDLLMGERLAVANHIAIATAELLTLAEAEGLDHPCEVLRWAHGELATYAQGADAERKARAIGDPNCPAGYR